MECKIDGCHRKSRTRGLCSKHYSEWCRRMKGVPIRKRNVSMEFLKNSRSKFHIVGLFLADGNVRHRENRTSVIEIKLKDHDEDLIAQCAKFFNINYRMTSGYARFSLSNEQIFNEMVKYGVVPRKSYKDVDISRIPTEYWRDFLLGFLEGDGTIARSSVLFIGNISLMNKICNMIHILGFNVTVRFKSKKPLVDMYEVRIRGGHSEMSRFLKYIYEDSPIIGLRKYKRALDFDFI